MSILQSDIINSFIDQSYETNNEEIQTYPSLHQDSQIENMYDLLLQKNNTNDPRQLSEEKSLTNDNLYQFNYQFSSSSTTPPICHTINPKQLTPKISSISTSSSSSFITSSEFEYNDHDTNSIDLETPISTTPIHPTSQLKPNNWSMNDEFKDAIATWINQNNSSNNQTKKKSNSISTSSNQKFQRTSITKRRKSDSLVSSLPNLSLDPPIQLSTSHTTTNTTPSTTNTTTTTSTTSTSPSTTPLIPEDPTIEEEEKPFKCDGCTKAFRRSEHLKRHVRSVHSNVRPFPCKFCEKKFSRSDNLAQHLRTHNKH